MDERSLMNECWQCINKQPVPGNAHIACVNPDPEMTGDPHGIKNGWFIYPFCFDPVWKTKVCVNFESKAVSDAVSGAVSESKSQ